MAKDELRSLRRQVTDALSNLGPAARAELERQGYQVGNKKGVEIKKILQQPPRSKPNG